jgi:hypothetical protein
MEKIKTDRIEVGDYVKYIAKSKGSTGVVEDIQNGRCYVRWYYGKDVSGKSITALSGLGSGELSKVSEDEFLSVKNRRGFGE